MALAGRPLATSAEASAPRRRLRAERPWQEHAGLYRDLFADRRVAEALWPGAAGGPREHSRAVRLLEEDIRHWAERSFGPWVFFETDNGLFIGRGGLRTSSLGGHECVELLYAVRSDSWGQGYATEIARLAVAHARRLGLTEVVGFTATTNVASRRVLEKAGMRAAGTIERAGVAHWLGQVRPIG
jgi:[ribosomal protein S5]-alanine N-acetyltransferase